MKDKRLRGKWVTSIWLCICLLVSYIGAGVSGMEVQAAEKVRVVGYLPTYRTSTIDSIDYSALTHLNLSFVTYKNGVLSCDITDETVQKIREKCKANNVKMLIALGGGGGFDVSSGNPFETAEQRTAMINELMEYVTRWELDGIDIDIEVEAGNTLWNHFDAFIEELSGRLKTENKLLTIAVASWFAGNIQNSTYDYFDFINLMTYDEHAGDGPLASQEFVESTVAYFRGKGITNDRMTIGVPFYGFGSGGWNDAYTYAQIVTMTQDAAHMDYYNGIYYNGADTIKKKAEYAKDFGGVMIWELGQDAGGSDSLLKVIKDTLGDAIGDPNGDQNGDSTQSGSAGGDPGSESGGNVGEENEFDQGSENGGNVGEENEFDQGSENGGNVGEENEFDQGSTEEGTGKYPTWSETASYKVGDLVFCNGKVYECMIEHTANSSWVPGTVGLETIWQEYTDLVNVPSDGDMEDQNEGTDTSVTGVSLNVDTLNLQEGDTAYLTAVVLPENAANKNVVWMSSDSTVAVVLKNGMVSAVKEGIAEITVITRDGEKSASCIVNVAKKEEQNSDKEDEKPADSEKEPETETEESTETETGGSAETGTEESTETETGGSEETGTEESTETETGGSAETETGGSEETEAGGSAETEIENSADAATGENTETETENSADVATGESTETGNRADAATGKNTETETGKSTETETGENAGVETEEKTDTTTGEIKEDLGAGQQARVTKIQISGISSKIAAGQKIQLTATVLPVCVANKSVKWESSNKKYAVVDEKGVVRAKKTGANKTVTITATATDGSGIKEFYRIKIMPKAVKKITLKSAKTVKAGQSIQVKASVSPSEKVNKILSWSSSNTKYATVNEKGKVQTKKAGKGKTVKITARATDGSGKKTTIRIQIE